MGMIRALVLMTLLLGKLVIYLILGGFLKKKNEMKREVKHIFPIIPKKILGKWYWFRKIIIYRENNKDLFLIKDEFSPEEIILNWMKEMCDKEKMVFHYYYNERENSYYISVQGKYLSEEYCRRENDIFFTLSYIYPQYDYIFGEVGKNFKITEKFKKIGNED